MRHLLLLALLLAAPPARAAPPAAIIYKPGRWVEVPAASPGEIVAPGATTVVGAARAEAQYALPMSEPWATTLGGVRLDITSIPPGGWQAAEIGRSSGAAARDGILRALPAGSILTRLGGVRRRVPEAVDLIICYDFAESKLQPQERAAVERFVRRGGAVLLIFVSRAVPAASARFWRSLFGAGDAREKQAPGLPRGLLVPNDFTTRIDIPESAADRPFVWQRAGRGIVMAVGLPAREKMPERSKETERFFRRIVARVRANCRPVGLGPVEPDVFRLFDSPAWSAEPRRRLALLAVGYTAAAAGLLLSFGAMLAKRRWAWLGGAVCIAAGGAALVFGFTAGTSGLALDTTSVIIVEPGAAPVQVGLARISRLGPGGAPQLMSAAPMPPRLLLYSRHSASEKTWVTYRFVPDGATVEPLLGIGQSLCLASVRAAPENLALLAAAPAPKNADALEQLFRRRWAMKGVDYEFRWVQAPGGPHPFTVSAEGRFVQIRRGPALVAVGSR